jgi:hypothetical protein
MEVPSANDDDYLMKPFSPQERSGDHNASEPGNLFGRGG